MFRNLQLKQEEKEPQPTLSWLNLSKSESVSLPNAVRSLRWKDLTSLLTAIWVSLALLDSSTARLCCWTSFPARAALSWWKVNCNTNKIDSIHQHCYQCPISLFLSGYSKDMDGKIISAVPERRLGRKGDLLKSKRTCGARNNRERNIISVKG